MADEGKDAPPHERELQNAREPLSADNSAPGAWDGPFVALGADDCALVNDGAGKLFAVVHLADCGKGGSVGAKARATRIAEALNRDQHRFERVMALPETEAELVDRWWERLRASELNAGPPMPSDDRVLTISRDQLVEAMTDAALLAIGPDDQVELAQSVAALAHELATMARNRAEDGAEGHAALIRRARAMILTYAMGVTRLMDILAPLHAGDTRANRG
jgi:hypothetical protein